jgi:hypothetical protein
MTRSNNLRPPARAPAHVRKPRAPGGRQQGRGRPMGDDNTDTAASRMRHLNTYFREHPVTGPAEGHTTTRTSTAPLRLATVDHVRASVREVVDHTRKANPAAGPAPSRSDAVYDWCHEHTQHSDETVRLRTAIIEYRQYLEHAIRAGDTKVVRPIRCPECNTFGLMWPTDGSQAAVCTNTECVDRDGLSHAFTLAELATRQVTSRKNLRPACAT